MYNHCRSPRAYEKGDSATKIKNFVNALMIFKKRCSSLANPNSLRKPIHCWSRNFEAFPEIFPKLGEAWINVVNLDLVGTKVQELKPIG